MRRAGRRVFSCFLVEKLKVKLFSGSSYRCFSMSISVAPLLEVLDTTTSSEAGEHVALTCWIMAYPSTTAWWTKKGADCKCCKLESNIRRSVMLTSSGPYKKELHLIIRKVSDADFGHYTCHANSSSGYTNRAIYLNRTASRSETGDEIITTGQQSLIADNDIFPNVTLNYGNYI